MTKIDWIGFDGKNLSSISHRSSFWHFQIVGHSQGRSCGKVSCFFLKLVFSSTIFKRRSSIPFSSICIISFFFNGIWIQFNWTLIQLLNWNSIQFTWNIIQYFHSNETWFSPNQFTFFYQLMSWWSLVVHNIVQSPSEYGSQ